MNRFFPTGMKKFPGVPAHPGVRLVLTLAVTASFGIPAWAQDSQPKASKAPSIRMAGGFAVGVYEDDGSLRARISGDSAEVNPATRDIQVEKFRLEILSPGSASEPEIIITADQALYSEATRSARSSGLINMASGDGQFAMSGKGFAWDLNSGKIQVDEHIETNLTPHPDPSPGKKDDESDTGGDSPKDDISRIGKTGFVGNWQEIRSLTIHSETLTYDTGGAVATYRNNVRAFDGRKLEVTGEELNLQLRPESQTLDQIIIERSVVVKLLQDARQYDIRAEKAVYQLSEDGGEALVFTGGNPSWNTPEASGSGETLSFYLPEKKVSVSGEASSVIKVPPKIQENLSESLRRERLFSDTLTIVCDHYEHQGQELVISGIRNITSGSSNLESDSLVLALDPDMKVTGMKSPGEFVLTSILRNEEFLLTGPRLDLVGLDTEAPVARIDGDSGHWQWGLQKGGGSSMTMTLANSEFVCRDQAWLEIFTGTAVQRIDGSAPARVECLEYRYVPGLAVLTGDVSVRHPQWSLDARSISIVTDPSNGSIRTLKADGPVVMEATVPGVFNNRPGQRIEKLLGGLIRDGVPWKMWCREFTLNIDPVSNDINDFTAMGDVRLTRGGNVGTGQLMRMIEGSHTIELTRDPVFTLESGMKMIGATDTRFLWDLPGNKFNVNGGYKIQLPGQAIKQF